MKLLFDQNLSRKLAEQLKDIFPGSSHVQFHELEEQDDNAIWDFAKQHGYCIVTQDADFADKSRLYRSPPKVVWLRCGNAPTKTVETLLRSGLEAINELINNEQIHCLELF